MKWLLVSVALLLGACSTSEHVDINRVDVEQQNEEVYMLKTPADIEPIYAAFTPTDDELPNRPENVTLHLYFPSADVDEIKIFNVWYIDGGKAMLEDVHTEAHYTLKKSATTTLKQLIDCDDCQLAP